MVLITEVRVRARDRPVGPSHARRDSAIERPAVGPWLMALV